MKEWIKPGCKVYLKSYTGWVKSGYTTIMDVDTETFTIKRDPRVRICIATLMGDFLEFKNICQVYLCKEDLEQKISRTNKREIIKKKISSLTEEEIDQIYNIIFPNDIHT